MTVKRPAGRSNKTHVPGKLTDEDIYRMMMLHKYQCKNYIQLAREFGITASEAYDVLARRQVGGCCG